MIQNASQASMISRLKFTESKKAVAFFIVHRPRAFSRRDSSVSVRKT